MNRRRIIPDPILVIISIFVVAGFQVYWLKNNYDREKKNLLVNTGVDFQETVRKLQAVKLKINHLSKDPLRKHNVRIFVSDGDTLSHAGDVKEKHIDTQQIITMVNAIRDGEKHDSNFKATTVVTTGKEKFIYHSDSLLPGGDFGLLKKQDIFFDFLSGVDSLQDSLKISEITDAYSKRLKEDKILVPFTVIKIDSVKNNDQNFDFSNVVVGFSHPKTYQLKLGNIFPYLSKKIAAPIAFSFFLVGLTIISFILLYRNLVRERRLTEVKNEFISNITHELKTPIATVSVAIEALRNFDAVHDPGKTKEYLDISALELQRLGLLIDKVLKLSMLENRNIELKKEKFDMRDLINEVLQIMKVQFEKLHAEVDVVTKGNHFNIEADRLHMASVLYNLLDNALKYSKQNPVISIQLSSVTKNILELKIKDSGLGIQKQYQSKIFDKFFRIADGDKHNTKGHGLGLSYVKEIIISHRGYIAVESEPGKGSTFIIMLPMKAAAVVDFGNGRKIFKMKLG